MAKPSTGSVGTPAGTKPPRARHARRKPKVETVAVVEVVEVVLEPPPAKKRRAKGRAGRPAHVPTRANRDLIEIMLGAGESLQIIAAAIKISVPTLRTHYADELEHGWAKSRAAVVKAMFAAAQKGVASAQKNYLDRSDSMADRTVPPKQSEQPAAAPRLGKKEAAQVAADNPDTTSPLGAILAKRQAAMRMH